MKCSQLLLVSRQTTGVYLTYSNDVNFPACGIWWEMAFKPTYVRRKCGLPLYICVLNGFVFGADDYTERVPKYMYI